MNGPSAHYLDAGRERLHLQHGPIDLVIGIDGSPGNSAALRHRGFAAAHGRFRTILSELMDEIALLKSPAWPDSPDPSGATAVRMMRAVRPFTPHFFITPMAAVAGAVADEMLAAIVAAYDSECVPQRIHVNNGGDIALHLAPDSQYRLRMAREDGLAFGDFTLDGSDPTRGIATSGRGGRSLSMGIADSATVFATNAAAADAAATLVANAVDLPGHPAIQRAPADTLVDDSDLGPRLVVTGRSALAAQEICAALDAGLAVAETFIDRGLIHRAALFLDRSGRLASPHPHSFTLHAPSPHLQPIMREPAYARA